ncbi:MAG: ABC transporter [Bacteroidetes bacterium MedPE-SWsnd-G2]|nr:MAG: ABC transporter [Bacteroidetes bacterium MedPE-SWsnd-G2]
MIETKEHIETNKEVLVKVEGLSKKFCKNLKRSLWYGLQELNPFKSHLNDHELRKDEFWAVKDVSFELRRGECLGLIGHNGAGKSTLLKMLNGLINPDEGKITIKGKVGALIELGAGFNPILTGRENIYNNAAVLGFTKAEINAKLEGIIDFAEIREFIDMPVQNYSSGMKVRLGFAIAAQLQPDVLIIDEVLAVGDMGFVLKCFKTIDAMLPNTAVIFVSHSMPMVSRICNQIMLMQDGLVKFYGNDTSSGIDLYYSRFAQTESNLLFSDNTIELKHVSLLKAEKNKDNIYQVNWMDDFNLLFRFKVLKPLKNPPIFQIVIFDKEQRPVAYLNFNDDNSKIELNSEIMEFVVCHKNIQLSKGVYTVDVVAKRDRTKGVYLRLNSVLTFQLLHDLDIFPPFILNSEYKLLDNE